MRRESDLICFDLLFIFTSLEVMHHAICERRSSTPPLWPCGSIHPTLFSINKWHLLQTRFSWWIDVNWNVEWLSVFVFSPRIFTHFSSFHAEVIARLYFLTPSGRLLRQVVAQQDVGVTTLFWRLTGVEVMHGRSAQKGWSYAATFSAPQRNFFLCVFVFSAPCILVSDNFQDLPPR